MEFISIKLFLKKFLLINPLLITYEYLSKKKFNLDIWISTLAEI